MFFKYKLCNIVEMAFAKKFTYCILLKLKSMFNNQLLSKYLQIISKLWYLQIPRRHLKNLFFLFLQKKSLFSDCMIKSWSHQFVRAHAIIFFMLIRLERKDVTKNWIVKNLVKKKEKNWVTKKVQICRKKWIAGSAISFL